MHFIDEAFWIVLGRAASAVERRDELRNFDGDHAGAFVGRLLSSPEFRVMANAWKAGRETGRVLTAQEHGLRALGADDRFVRLAYGVLQDREPDEEGLRYFVNVLAGGGTRVDVVRAIVLSDEFQRRYWHITPDAGVVPQDTQICELANPAKWDNPEWMALLRDLQTIPDHKLSMHRKSYEFTQLLYALRRVGHLRDDTTVLSVGAGHECVLYWLANHVGRVVATDLYEGVWQSVGAKEGDEHVLKAPEDYAAVDLYTNPHQTPHMVVRMNETVFTTVFALLERQ